MAKQTIALLTGGITKDEKTGRWRTLRLGESEAGGFCNDRLRVKATAVLWQRLKCPVITCGSLRNNYESLDEPTTAAINKLELVELGVPADMVIEEGLSFTTYQDLIWLHGWSVGTGTQEIHILSNDWHLGRTMAFIEHAPCFEQMRRSGIRFIDDAAEEILLNADANRWGSEISAAREHQGYAERVRREAAGIEQIKAGTYRFG